MLGDEEEEAEVSSMRLNMDPQVSAAVGMTIYRHEKIIIRLGVCSCRMPRSQLSKTHPWRMGCCQYLIREWVSIAGSDGWNMIFALIHCPKNAKEQRRKSLFHVLDRPLLIYSHIQKMLTKWLCQCRDSAHAITFE